MLLHQIHARANADALQAEILMDVVHALEAGPIDAIKEHDCIASILSIGVFAGEGAGAASLEAIPVSHGILDGGAHCLEQSHHIERLEIHIEGLIPPLVPRRGGGPSSSLPLCPLPAEGVHRLGWDDQIGNFRLRGQHQRSTFMADEADTILGLRHLRPVASGIVEAGRAMQGTDVQAAHGPPCLHVELAQQPFGDGLPVPAIRGLIQENDDAEALALLRAREAVVAEVRDPEIPDVITDLFERRGPPGSGTC